MLDPNARAAQPACFPPSPALSGRRRAILHLAAVLLLPAATVTACASEVPGNGHPVAMSIVDRDTGQTLTAYRHAGRTYVAGQPSARYAIRLSNRSAGRVLVVLSVDGVNVISGETAAASQTGYALDAWQSADIAGWRKGDTAIAAFVFAALGDSYAARTGRPDNVGVVGAAVFLERPAPVALVIPPSPAIAEASGKAAASLQRAESAAGAAKADSSQRSAAAPTAPTAQAAPPPAAAAAGIAPTERLGTGHGQREWSVSRHTHFARLTPAPQDLLEIAYDSYENLVLAGAIAAPTGRARAFPGDEGRGFVADPPPLR
jgi:hypothetical protein